MSDRRRFVFVVLFLLLPGLVAEARLEDDAFDKLAKKAKQYVKKNGTEAYKTELIQALGGDDQLRSVKILVDWAVRSAKRQRKELGPAFEKADETLRKIEDSLRKTYKENFPPKTMPAKTKQGWDAAKRARKRTKIHFETEPKVRYQVALALERTRDGEAIRWLLKKGLKSLRKAEGAEAVALAAVDAFTRAEPALVEKAVLTEAKNAEEPASRVLCLDWIGKHRPKGGTAIAVGALSAPESVVRRAAVRCLRALDDGDCVRPLIDALLTARGVLAVEIEAVLHHYTGQNNQSSHAVWLEWWEREGEAWRNGVTSEERHAPPKVRHKRGGTSFYGLRTDSDRIVFVLDRSGSMKSSASRQSRSTGQKPTGPKPTGPKPAGPMPKNPNPKEEEVIEGDSKMDVAKNQLIWSIKHLTPDVFFNVIFFSSGVQTWLEPPEMRPATPENKKAAVEWVEKVDADGSTQIFDALMKALEYADNLGQKDPSKGGCDTIFLLSDGSPTVGPTGGEILKGDALEEAWEKVTHANRVFRCVIHTIGIGRGHDPSLMVRIARETGGTYKAVGSR